MQFWWSSPWADGGSSSGEKGEVEDLRLRAEEALLRRLIEDPLWMERERARLEQEILSALCAGD